MDSQDIFTNFIGAASQAFAQMDALAHGDETKPPWSILMDIDNIPDEGLQWFGQFVGTVVNPNLTYNEQRQQIRDRAGWQRGTPNAIINAVRALLTGTQTVSLIERDTSAYHFNVATYGDETPDQNLVLLAIQHNKPAGLQFTYSIIGGSPSTAQTYENLFIDEPTYAGVYADDQTYEDVYLNP
jgi:hypothetical protein